MKTEQTICKQTSGKQGFTLIEVALAIVVVAIGVMAVISLISAGLDASAKAIADTQSAILADGVFNGLRSESLKQSEAANWTAFWTDFKGGGNGYPVYIPCANALSYNSIWDAASPQAVQIKASTDADNPLSEPLQPWNTLNFSNKTQRASGVTGINNSTLRYRLTVVTVPLVPPAVTFSNVCATLKIWDGAYGTPADKNASVFYTEFNDPGNL